MPAHSVLIPGGSITATFVCEQLEFHAQAVAQIWSAFYQAPSGLWLYGWRPSGDHLVLRVLVEHVDDRARPPTGGDGDDERQAQ
jgi:hypothetical protein